MLGMLMLSFFTTCFLILLVIFSSIRSPNQEGEIDEPVSLKELLKKGNKRLKTLLVRKKDNKRNERLEQTLSLAGVPLKAEEFVVFRWFAVLISGGLFFLPSHQIVMFLIGGLLGYYLPLVWLKRKQKKRVQLFNAGMPGMLTSIIGSLKAGFSFLQSLQMVAEESDSPIKEEIGFVLKLIQYGTSMEEALIEWKKRMPSEDLDLLVEAILIQRQVGGNLAFLLEKIVDTMRARNKLENQVQTLTAQGRLSGMIIGFLPVGLGVVIYFLNPDYITPLFTHPIGQGLLIAAVISEVTGFMFIRKITTIEV
ncbi:type II secretion system F family protein [Bacillus thermotolerans]|uniref:Flp pilus assembly protein TadB n=1 Tax=Bacillus thermotolerans TaxID=1221996 RepID=A0A0F5HVD7_BACTR|nr:type II secretion system F family protein [Bacillus thermotolerans]KKB36812.1 Flp pilus assembly protein TadB [Bacillus thermotolerans]KKB40439.1 Flp pilus assembly protein TadB [Bacillus thermotolerans]